ncbi:hypothetical protein M8J75_011724 [Diaphorina citri]|nr:hypothetical protein M8J75_011724 [Diaphorina citri]
MFTRNKGLKIARAWLGPELFILIGDVHMVTTVLNHNLKKAKIYHVLDEVLHRGIFVNPDIPKWKASRKLIVNVFHFSVLKSYIRIFHSEAAILVNKWRHLADGRTSFNPEEDINLATFDMVMMSTLGINPRAQENPSHEFLVNFDSAFQIGMSRMLNPILHSDLVCRLIGLKARQKAHVQVLIDEAQRTLDRIRERQKMNREKENAEIKDPSSHLMDPEAKSFAELIMENADYVESDDEELISQIITIIGAGQDTTKTENMVVLIMLAIHADVQDKVLEEIDRVLGRNTTHCPSYEDLCQLEYLECVIKETLRLFPAAPLIGRHIDEDFILDGLTIPAGVTVLISIFALHRDPKYYSSPARFDPSRWQALQAAQRPPNAFMPFSCGPRNCVGGKYAMLQMKTVLSTLLRHYRVLPGAECRSMQDVKFEIRITLKMNEKCAIRLQRRM